ncbi:MAG: AAA family ATPase [Labilibaculum antarcticum]
MKEASLLKNGHNSLEQISPSSGENMNLENCIVHINEEISEPDPIICIEGTPVFSRGNISITGGKQKCKKTFFVCMPIVSALIGNYGIFSSNPSHNMKVLLFDCEQARGDSLKVLKRIYKMAGFPEAIDNENIILYSLRENSVKERQYIIMQAMREQRPDFVIIDGLVDITEDFNSVEKSSETIQLIMTLSSKYNCHICSVLHENKGNGNLRGHLGSIASQKAETVIQLTKQGEITKVEGTYTRSKNFDPFYFKINSQSIPIITGERTSNEIKLEEMKEYLEKILADKPLKYGKLIKEYTSISGKAESTSKKHIKKAIENGLITLEETNYRMT